MGAALLEFGCKEESMAYLLKQISLVKQEKVNGIEERDWGLQIARNFKEIVFKYLLSQCLYELDLFDYSELLLSFILIIKYYKIFRNTIELMSIPEWIIIFVIFLSESQLKGFIHNDFL